MNAATYLKELGWRGDGFSLDTTDRGLAKPLLVQRKNGLDGLGAKKHDFSNQWWLNSFDKSLKSIGTVQPLSTTIATIEPQPAKNRLYSGFVRGETLSSTIHNGISANSTPANSDLQMAPSMSTVGLGFVLGETPAQTLAAGSPAPVIITKEIRTSEQKEKTKKEKLERKEKRKEKKSKPEPESAGVMVEAPVGSADSVAGKEKKKKKSKKLQEDREDVKTSDVMEAVAEQVEAQASEPLEPAISQVSEKKSKKRKRETNVSAEIERMGQDVPSPVAEPVVAEDAAEGETVLPRKKKSKSERESKRDKKDKKEKKEKKQRKSETDAQPDDLQPLQAEDPVPDESAESAEQMNGTTGQDEVTDTPATSAPSFIPLGADTSTASTAKPPKLPKKPKMPNMKSQKHILAMKIYKRPDGTIDPFAIDPANAPGGKKLMHIPTVHPKTGKALTKKARKIIAKGLVKKETRAEIKERRKTKKILRAERLVANKQAKPNAPEKVSKGIKYAREKARRVAKREAKAGNGVGTGANSTPLTPQVAVSV